MRTRLNFALVKVQKGWEDRSLDQLEMEKREEVKKEEKDKPKKHVRSEVSAAAIRPSPESGIRSADSSPRVSQAAFPSGLGLSIPTSPTPRRRPSKRGHRRSTSDILHNSGAGVNVFKVDKPDARWKFQQQHPQHQQPQQPHYPPPLQYSQPLNYPQQYPPPPHYPPQHSPEHSLGQPFQPVPSQPPQHHPPPYNYTHAPYSSSPPYNGHFPQNHSPTRPSPLHGPPQTPPTSTPTSASGRPNLAPLHVSLPPISTSINSPTSAPDRVTLPPMRALYDSPVMSYDVTSPRAHLPSPQPHSPGQREVDDDAAESLMYFSRKP